MSTTVHNTNQACCSIPPVYSNYQPKGIIKPFANFKRVYVTGPQSPNALICVYDIFGFFPQTQQGADMLASALKTTVYMPDIFEPNHPFPIEKFPPKTPEDKDELQKFFGTPASPSENVKKLVSFGEAVKSEGNKKLGVYGFCWGGKVTVVGSGGENSPFDASAIIHPAMLSADDSRKLSIPLAIYISKDEPLDEYSKILEVLSTKPFADKNDHKTYSNMFHGWAAARADLTKEDNKKAFKDVYGRLAEFFKKSLA